MGLLELLKNYKKFDKDPNLLILGLDNAGKTTLLHKLIYIILIEKEFLILLVKIYFIFNYFLL